MCVAHRLYRTQTTQKAVARPPANTTMAKMIVASSGVRIDPLYVVCEIFEFGTLPLSSARPSICADVVKFCIEIEVIVLKNSKCYI